MMTEPPCPALEHGAGRVPWMIEAGQGGSVIITSSAAGIRGHVPTPTTWPANTVS